MRPTDEIERGEWLAERLGRWGSVGGVAGAGFEAYARILHPAPADGGPEAGAGAAGESDAARRSWRQVASHTGRVVNPLAQWWSIGGSRELIFTEPEGFVRVSAPRTGRLDPDLLAALVPALSGATSSAVEALEVSASDSLLSDSDVVNEPVAVD